MAKKYYWIRLKTDFFKSLAMKKLRRIAGGDTYTIIYLKLQLLSAEAGGWLYYEGVESTFTEELAILTDEDVKDVRNAINILYDMGLLEIRKHAIKVRKVQGARDRSTKEYREWRTKVFERDNYTCQDCGSRGVELQAHHILAWAKYPKERFNVDNGVKLCTDCHKARHKKGDN